MSNFSLPERLRARDPRAWPKDLPSDAFTADPRQEWRRAVIAVATWAVLVAVYLAIVAALASWAFFGDRLF